MRLIILLWVGYTSFSVFEDIIRTTITSDLYTHQQIMLDKFLVLVEDEEERSSMKNDFSKIKPNECDIESLIKLLKNRHEQWKLLALEKNLDQDFSLANSSLFLKEANLYDGDTSESEEEDELSYSDQGTSLNNSYSGISFFPSPKDDGNEDNQSKTNEFTPIEYIN